MIASAMKRIVITGATRGLGAALLAEFSAVGHTIVGCGKSPAGVAKLAQQYPAPHAFSAVDVTDAAAVEAWAHEVLAAGPVDLLINNAAVIHPTAALWNISAEDFDRCVDVNIKGVANVLRSFLPAMTERGAGVVVNLSSGWGRSTSPEVAPYCATKWAIEGLTQALAQELPEGMAAVPLNPGIIDTDMLREAFGEGAGSYIKPDAWGKLAAPFILGFGPEQNGESLTVPGA